MATVNAAEMLNDLARGWVEPSILARRDQKRPPYSPIAQKFTIPSTSLGAGNIVRLWKFPAGSFLLNWRSTPSDLDTNGAPALTYSILTTDDADVTQLTIVSASTNGQTGAGSDAMIGAVMGRYVGNQWCVFKVGTAAATAAAGNLKVFCSFAIGVLNRTTRGIYLRDPEA
jgi:hypothetical protein